MKILNLILGCALTQYTFAQGTFENGSFINNQNETITCLIRNEDWKFSPAGFEYRLTPNGKVNTMLIDSASRFEITGSCVYKRAKTKIDQSSDEIGKLSTEMAPNFEEKTVYLKAIVLGSVHLYEYTAPLMTRFFYSTDGQQIEPLVYKKYANRSDAFLTNETFKHQLNQILKTASLPITEILKTEYSERSLKKIFKKYNEHAATKDQSSIYVVPTRKPVLQIWLQPSFRRDYFRATYTTWDEFTVDFGGQSNVTGGLELEYVLPYYKKRWSIFTSATYAHYKVSKLSNTNYAALIDYYRIEVPLGVRYHYNLSKKDQLFASLSNVRTIDFDKSKVDLQIHWLKIETKPTYMLGLGYAHDAFSAECRWQFKREITHSFVKNEYTNISMVFGWRLARF